MLRARETLAMQRLPIKVFFTYGQFICIGVTLIEWSQDAWNKARMAHISSNRAALIHSAFAHFLNERRD
jgi:hypothetical protein